MTFSPAQVEQLLRPVNPRRVQRDNHGMSHLAAYDVSAHLTRIFGFGGWRKEILSLELVAEDAVKDEGRNRLGWFVTYRCTMRLIVHSSTDEGDWWNEDGATGSASNLPDRGDAHDFALKNAISYALKRCAKDLGDQFGLSLYNKGSTAALVGRTLATPDLTARRLTPEQDMETGLPDLAPDWDEAPPGRADGLPTNRDGSLSRSRTTDEEKEKAGVMTAAQLAEHTALQPKRGEQTGRTVRMRPCDCQDCAINPGGPWMIPASNQDGSHVGGYAPEAADPWQDQPAAPLDGVEDQPGTIDPKDQRAIHAAWGKLPRDDRMNRVRAIIGRDVSSTNELTYKEGATVAERAKARALK